MNSAALHVRLTISFQLHPISNLTAVNYSVCSNMFTQKEFCSDNMFYSEGLEGLTPEFYNKHAVATNRIFYHN